MMWEPTNLFEHSAWKFHDKLEQLKVRYQKIVEYPTDVRKHVRDRHDLEDEMSFWLIYVCLNRIKTE